MEIKSFLVTTRPAEKYRTIAGGKCFDVRNIPLTRIVYNQDPVNLKIKIEAYEPSLVIVTSSIGANVFLGAGIVGDFTIICIGRKTAEPFSALKRKVLVPGEENSTGIVDLVSHYPRDRTRIALCRSKKHSSELDEFLSSNGYNYRCFDLYDIEELRSSTLVSDFMNENCRGIILTSSMEAGVFASIARDVADTSAFRNRKIFCIGRPTMETAASLGLHCEPLNTESDFDAIVKEISKIHCNSGEWI